jgi:hypothetical protein
MDSLKVELVNARIFAKLTDDYLKYVEETYKNFKLGAIEDAKVA